MSFVQYILNVNRIRVCLSNVLSCFEWRVKIPICHVGTKVLSELDIVVPLQLLIGMFSDGVNSLKELANQRKARVSDLSGNTGARRVSKTLMPEIDPNDQRYESTVFTFVSISFHSFIY